MPARSVCSGLPGVWSQLEPRPAFSDALEKLVSVNSPLSSSFNASPLGREKIPAFLQFAFSLPVVCVACGLPSQPWFLVLWRALVTLQLMGKRCWEVLQKNSPPGIPAFDLIAPRACSCCVSKGSLCAAGVRRAVCCPFPSDTWSSGTNILFLAPWEIP